MEMNLPEAGDTNDFFQKIQAELDKSRRALQEIQILLEQSQGELAKLTQRNAAITGHLQLILSQFDTASREDIRMAFTSAMDSQQRLLVMRGQIEKLQSDQASLKKYVGMLEMVKQYLTEGQSKGKDNLKGSSNLLEMLIRAQESERQRLSRQMHDGPAQALSNFIVQTEIASRLFEIDPNRAKEELAALKTAAMNTFQKVRTFIFALRPMMLDDLGLIPTLRRYVESFKEQWGLDVNLTIKGQEKRLDPTLEVVIFRAIQELMGNAARHNENQPVKVQINIQLLVSENLIKVTVSDTGKGFDVQSLPEGDGLGLKLIRERIEMLNGRVDIESTLGQGSRITLEVPISEVK